MMSAGSRAVDVWTVRLDAPAALSRACRALLSAEEAAHADRFVTEALRTSYAVSHGALRVLLAHYLARAPRDVAFTHGPAGKPALAGESRLRFNMSHSGRLAAYAFTCDCEIGIDIEEMQAIPDLESIAERFFCRTEASQLLSLTGDRNRQESFFRCWTRKESYIKALGDGLTVPLDQFQVTLLDDAPPALVHIADDTRAAAEWTVHHLEPAPRYVGAVAYRSAARELELQPLREAHEIFALIP